MKSIVQKFFSKVILVLFVVYVFFSFFSYTYADIGDIGHWRDNSGSQIPGTTFGGFDFAGEIRNDGIYTKPNASTIQVSESGDYLVIATTHDVDTSNGRYNSQLRIQQVAGTGDNFSSYFTGYSRSNAEDESWTRAIGVIVGASAGSQFQIQKRRDIDAPTGGSVIGESDLQIIRLNQTNYGIYGIGGSGNSYGGTTPNTVGVDSVVAESDTSAIEGSTIADTITLKGDNKKYLVAWSTSFATGGSRTQRVGHLEYNGMDQLPTRSYCYSRNASNEYCGIGGMDVIETSTVDIDIQIEAFRGQGVAADQGGADVDGNLQTDGNGQIIILELPETVEAFNSQDSTGLQSLTTAQTLNIARDVNFSDTSSFTKASNTEVLVSTPADIFSWANIWGARNNVSSTSRQTAYGSITIDGVEQTTGRHGGYSRGNQGTQDTFGLSFQPAGFFSLLSPGVSLGINSDPIVGGAGGGGDRTQANTLGFFSLNLDTFDVNSAPTDISLSNNIIDENVSTGSVIGTFSTTDSDVADAHVYNFVTGSGSVDNSAFTLSGSILSISTSPDFETQSSYSIRMQSYDEQGGYYEEIFTININDLDEVAPVIALTGATPVNVSFGSGYTDAGATCSDDVDPSCSVIVGGDTIDTSSLGIYTITYDAIDAAGNNAIQITRTVNVVDTVAPVISLTGSGGLNIIKNATYTDAGATCTDDVDATCTVTVGGATVDTSTLGSYVITYDATDIAGNTATQVTRTVNVIAGDVPVITLSGSVSETVEVNTTYSDAGATANDSEDGDITADIVTMNPVNTSATGSYTVTYDVTDSSDNDAIQVTRTVNVVDTTPPVLTLTGTGVINIIKNASYSDAGATANDSFQGDITADIVTVNPVDTTTLGTYTITYNVSDSSGNTATQVSRTVNVIAGDVPVITLSGSVSETVEVNTTYSDAGATASDSEDGDITADIITVNPVDITTLGTYTITYNVSDSSDNAATQVTRTVNVVDTTAPVITLTGSDLVNLTQGDSYTDAGATCSDNYDVNCSVIVGGDSVDTTRVGTYVVTYDATDSTGNTATQVSRTVNVIAAPLLINEVEYDTSGNESQSEWFEIYNPTAGTVNIENWTITEKVGASSDKTYTFGSVIISAGGYIVVTNETTDFQTIYPSINPDVDLPGTSYFSLKNSPDDELELKDPSGTSIDYVSWENTSGGWGLSVTPGFPICRLSVADTDTSTDWSDECIPTPGAQNDFNAIPTDIIISNNDIDENNSASATIGTLTTTDADIGDTHVYSLISGLGDSDNPSFSISGNTLSITPVTDYETKQSYDIRIQTDDGNGGVYEEAFTIDVNDLNLAPTDIALTNTNIDENNSVSDIIGVLSGSDDGENTNTLTFSLACAIVGADDTSFTISGTNLNAAGIYDFETKDKYDICIRVSDGLLSYDENFTIDINDLDEVSPMVVITPVTKLQNSSIVDTTIQVTDDVAVNAADISIGTGSTATTSALSCTQTSVSQVDCTISVDASGDLVIEALDTSANPGLDTETNYVIDTVAPNVPSVSVDTSAPNSINNPEITFSSLDNIGVDYYTVTYNADDGGVGTGTTTTLNPSISPINPVLDPDETVHTIIVTVFDTAGNSASTTIKFPPVININAPTTLSNTVITDSTVTITAPTGNDLTNITLIPNTTGASLGTCIGAGGDTTDPYATPVTCDINNISDSGSISITAEDAVNGAEGLNSGSYIIDTLPPVVTITAPTKLDNISITDTAIVITDETAISIADVSVDPSSTVSSSSFSCSQTSPVRVDCIIQIDDSGDLIISADDVAGNNNTVTESQYIIDTILPVITLITPSPETVEYLSSYTDGGAIFTDNIDGTGSLIGIGSVNTGILGSYSLDYDYTDIAGNTAATVTRTVEVVDTTIPVISLVGTDVTIEVGSSYSDAGATAIDNYDGDISPNIVSTGAVNTELLGTYTIYYDVTDSNGNIANQISREVQVIDTTSPIISLIGADELVLEVGSLYSELGATATDNYDTIGSGSIAIDSSAVDVNTVGSYDVIYNVSDSSGNPATQVIRTVTIQDTTPPVITVTGTGVTVEVNTSYIDAGATATDNYDGNLTSSISVVNPVDITKVGAYTVSYDVQDSSGNNANQVTRIVNVVDTTPPVITVTGTGVTVEVNTSYVDAGASATDNYDGDITADISIMNPVDITNLGSYTVTYDVIDANNNAATQVTRAVNVVDTTPPVISLIGSNSLSLVKNAAYTEFGATCNDNYDTVCNVTIAGDTVDTSTLGTYTVTYDVTDNQGNTATQLTRTVNVVAGDIPVISLIGSGGVIVEVNTNYLDAGATASDTEDGNITSNIVTVNPVDITNLGIYSITYDVTDSSDNIASQVSRIVEVVDTTPPTILLTGSGVINIFKNASYTEFGAICNDNYDTTCSVTIGGATVDSSTLGSYIVTYDVTDNQGNTATQLTRTVNVISGDVPVISLTGSGTITHEVNTPYIDAGATAFDTEDGDITANITSINGVNISATGSYTVTYDVDDFSDNSAIQVTRTVNIVDTTAPVMSLIGNAVETVNLGDSYIDAGVNCSDNYDTVCNVTIAGDTVDTSTLGTYIITYDAIDSEGNIAHQVTRTVYVVTGNTPVVTLTGPTIITLFKNSIYNDLGATAIDIEDGDISSSIVVNNLVDTSTIGSYIISYDVTDSNSNSAMQVTRTVNVISGDVPILSLLGTNPVFVEQNDTYVDAGATAIDTEEGDLSSDIIVSNTVDTSVVGTYTVSYNVIDSSDNTATPITRTVIVIDDDTDTDGDGVSDSIELIIGTNPNLTDTDGDGTSDSDNDLDGVAPFIEIGASNNGDANGDTQIDAIQNNVTSIPNAENSQYNSLEIESSHGGVCGQISSFASMLESELVSQDDRYNYNLGLWDFEIVCDTPGATVNIQLYLDAQYDTDNWIYRKYDENTGEYVDISNIVSYTTETIGTIPVTVINYSITDGGIYDQDGLENGFIVDPSGPAIRKKGSSGTVTHMDVCNETGGDFSGDYYDGICIPEDDTPVIIFEENQKDIQDDIIEETANMGVANYTLENNFDTCPIIERIQTPDYSYLKTGIFVDEDDSRYRDIIVKFEDIGIVDGYDDGTFKPFREMTRTEFLKVALISHCYEYQYEDPENLEYIDVDASTWQAKVITKAQSLGMINGDIDKQGNKVFRPNDIISKAEAIKILMRISMIQAEFTDDTQYTDINVDWHSNYVENGEALGLFDPKGDNNLFYPEDGVKREEMVDLIYRLVQLYR